MKRFLIVLGMVFMLVGLTALPLLAWPAPNVEGDCDSWTVTETATDEDWKNTEYWTIDGVEGQFSRGEPVPVPDTSAATTRTFTVRWFDALDNQLDIRDGVGKRDLEGCQPTTTTTSTTTTSTTTTTTPTPPTTQPPVTTSPPATTVTTAAPTATTTVAISATSVTASLTTAAPVTQATLPFTGPGLPAGALAAFATSLALLGTLLLAASRGEEESGPTRSWN